VAATNLAEQVVLSIRCPSCRLENDVSLAEILLSEEAGLTCACRGESECPPLYLAGLLSTADIRELTAVWQRLEHQAEGQGGSLRLAPALP
jgi:hypothetical protein